MQSSIFKQPPVFILSAPRSGSTLLRLILDKIPGVVSLPENSFFRRVREYHHLNLGKKDHRARFADVHINQYQIKALPIDHQKLKNKIIEEARNFKDIFELTALAFCESEGIVPSNQTILCEKTPLHIHYQKEILQTYPNAKFIYLVRHPLDVMASLKSCYWGSNIILIQCWIWRKGVRAMTHSNALLVKYEDLADTPEEHLKQICDFLDRSYSEKLLQTSNPNKLYAQDDPKSQKALRPISKENIGKWKYILSRQDNEAAIVEHVCRKEMKKLDYSLTHPPTDFSYYLSYLHNWIGYLFKYLYYLFKGDTSYITEAAE